MAETLEERWTLEAQTARNLEALDAEHAGRLDEAIALYERNVAEGFPGDLPYGRLVAVYEKRGALAEAERVLERAIQVFETSTRRTAQDRRAMVRVFRKRLALLRKSRAPEATRKRRSRAAPAEPG
jgi:tetratricopeptide (TPR) repeat protein